MKLIGKCMESVGGNILLIILIFLVFLAISFFSTAGILWLIDWAFNLGFWSWKTAVGIWLGFSLLEGIFTARVKVEK